MSVASNEDNTNTNEGKDTLSFIYLDNAASTPLSEQVIQAMIPYLRTHYGNPSSLHKLGLKTRLAIARARRQVAFLIGARDTDLVFTSGGTEANNLAIKGAALHIRSENSERNHLITSKVEHESVLEPFRELENTGFEVTCLPVTKTGLVDPIALRQSIVKNKTSLVSIMLANNEVGTIQPIMELAHITHTIDKNIVFHSDAIQAVGKIAVDVKSLGADLLSISSHKINGPKGIGAIYIREGVKLKRLIDGGGQESSLRSGTENVYGIAGFGKACEIAVRNIPIYQNYVRNLRDHLVNRVAAVIQNSRYNGSDVNRIPTNAHFTFLGVNGEDLIMKLDENGIAASTGSACSARKQKPSHVLKAMGFSYEEIAGSLRVSIGLQNTPQEIDKFISILSGVIKELRSFSPFVSKYNNGS